MYSRYFLMKLWKLQSGLGFPWSCLGLMELLGLTIGWWVDMVTLMPTIKNKSYIRIKDHLMLKIINVKR